MLDTKPLAKILLRHSFDIEGQRILLGIFGFTLTPLEEETQSTLRGKLFSADQNPPADWTSIPQDDNSTGYLQRGFRRFSLFPMSEHLLVIHCRFEIEMDGDIARVLDNTTRTHINTFTGDDAEKNANAWLKETRPWYEDPTMHWEEPPPHP